MQTKNRATPHLRALALRAMRLSAAAALTAALLWPAVHDRAKAAEPALIPACAEAHPAGANVPSALPVRHPLAPPAPAITAQAAAVVDAETGRLLYGFNEHEQRSPASTTKIMTAILALENVSQDSVFIAQSDAVRMSQRGSSVMGLVPGRPMSMRDLLYGLMLPSGNDAALDIALAVDGDVPVFVERMNEKAALLGLDDTHFKNPHGLDARTHYSSAYDLSMLGRYAMANEEFRTIAGTQWHQLSPPSDYSLSNGNSLLHSYPGADGVKIGWTNRAGWTLVASAVRDGRRVFVTVLNSKDRDADAAALFDWAFGAHSWTQIRPETVLVLKVLDRLGVGAKLARTISVCG